MLQMATEREALAKNAEGVRLHQSGDAEGALKAFSEALEIAPEHANIYRNRADAYRAADMTAEADADSAKADALVEAAAQAEIEAHKKTFAQKLWNFIARES